MSQCWVRGSSLVEILATCPGSHVFTWNTKPPPEHMCQDGVLVSPEQGADSPYETWVEPWCCGLATRLDGSEAPNSQALSIAYTVHQEAGWAADGALRGTNIRSLLSDGFTTITTYGAFMGKPSINTMEISLIHHA